MPVGDVAVGLARGDLEAARAARAPGSTTTTRSPTAKLWAPQTMPCGSPVPLASPTSTGHQWMVLPFFCGSASIVSTRPTTSGPVTSCAGVLERLELEAERGQPVRRGRRR